ncbi:hypothetical protein WJX75_006682 [Coccomyxa subellipsoidea]|uniref:Uncharacterized protein n=1 Tax=Coccomyxa subellipsoidea TaxID=248742 RepID=A0ABR2Z129_9CHLO
MSGQQEPDEAVEEDEVHSGEADHRPARRGPGDPVAKGMRRAHVVQTMNAVKKKLRKEVGTCGNQAAFLCVSAAITSTRGAEHVHYIIEASDDCVLTSAGCTFDETGNAKLSRHMEAGIMQALARQEDLDKVRRIQDMQPNDFSTKNELMAWLREAVKERVNAERQANGESVKAHIFARTNKPEWWPDGWDWSAKALETARREEMDSFFIVMRDCQAAAEKQKIDEEVQIRRGQHPSSRRRPNRAAVGEEQGAEDADSHSSEARAAPEGEPVSEDMHSAHSFSNSDAAADDIPVGSRGRGAASGGRGNLGRRSRGRGSRLGGGGIAVRGGGRGSGRGGRNGSGGRGRGTQRTTAASKEGTPSNRKGASASQAPQETTQEIEETLPRGVVLARR